MPTLRCLSTVVPYKSAIAKKRLLRLPVAAIRVGEPSSGASRVFLMEALPSGNCSVYQKIINFYVNGLERATKQSTPPLTKGNLKDILTLAQSDRERLLVKYAVFKTSGLSPTAARKYYGFDQIRQRAHDIEEAIQQIKQIRSTVFEMALDREKALAVSYGIGTSDSSSDDESNDTFLPQVDFSSLVPLSDIISSSNSNFFDIVDKVEIQLDRSLETAELDALFQQAVADKKAQFDSPLLFISHIEHL